MFKVHFEVQKYFAIESIIIFYQYINGSKIARNQGWQQDRHRGRKLAAKEEPDARHWVLGDGRGPQEAGQVDQSRTAPRLTIVGLRCWQIL